ncbi:MAG: penicillin-insensitive murein endopeptidase [Deltaproteobacteria bacterium]|nr:penicillin-insensitive murein endopeptidase [Deltaproteobacteria bacterium]
MRPGRIVLLALVAFAASGCATWSRSLPEGRTVSFGSTSSGFLLNGVPLADRGPGYVRARPNDGVRWGTPQLVGMIERSAARVQERHPRSSPLRVGDLSASHGGEHFRHRSHRTGRDVDILFYQTDGRGRSLPATGFYRFDQDGRLVTGNAPAGASAPTTSAAAAPSRPAATVASSSGGGGIRFDVARNWSFVEAMLEDPEAHVQWIFVADGLKALLLAHALRVRAHPETILRASYVLHQPRGAAPHDDHFHVRVSCSVEDLTLGCLQQGPLWPWMRKALEKVPVLAAANDEQLMLELFADQLTAELVPYALVQSEHPELAWTPAEGPPGALAIASSTSPAVEDAAFETLRSVVPAESELP